MTITQIIAGLLYEALLDYDYSYYGFVTDHGPYYNIRLDLLRVAHGYDT